MRTENKLLKNYIFLVFDKVVRFISSVFIMAEVANKLGPSVFGELSIFIVTLGMFGSFVIFGTDVVTLPIISKKRKKITYEIINIIFRIRVTNLSILTVVVFFLVFAKVIDWYYLLLPISGIFYIFNISEVYLNANSKNKVIAKCYGGVVLLSMFFRCVAILIDSDFIVYVYIQVIESVFSGVLLYKFSKIKFHYKNTIRKSLLKIILHRTKPIFLSSFLIMIYTRMDQLMISKLGNYYESGIYAAAFRIVDPFSFLIVALCLVFIPKIVKKDSYNSRVKFVEISILMSLFISMFVFFLSDIIIDKIYGYEFASAKDLVIVLQVAMLFNFIGIVLMRISTIDNKHQSIIKRVGFSALVNFALNFMLIPIYGAYGAAVASLIAQFCASIIGFYPKPTRYLLWYLISSFRFRELRKLVVERC